MHPYLAWHKGAVDIQGRSLALSLSMQVVHRYDEGHGPITALAVTPEDCVLAGCHNGCMLVFAPRTSAIQTKYNLGAAPAINELSATCA